MAAAEWLRNAVLYQIYPQSFADSNGDGIGDFAGIEAHLDHLEWLGVTAAWINPCFASPMLDAGYDIADFTQTAPRYGSRDDLVRLVDAAASRGIRILLDLVAGHTSDQHPWFVAEADGARTDRYIWSDAPAPGFQPSPGRRPGFYLPNFFPVQPALNFGYARAVDAEPWRQPVDAPGPRANRQALREIMDSWLRIGVAGFRVDMASSLVKDDPGWVETGKLWQELRGWLDDAHPGAVLLSEWGHPEHAVPAGFDADFFLHFAGRAMRSLWDNGYGAVFPEDEQGECFFDADGRGSPREFLDIWDDVWPVVERAGGLISLPSANHDFQRLSCGPRRGVQLRAPFVFLLTWPTVPAIYYGDEIGMRYLPDLPDREGSRLGPYYNRIGSRTPMQWGDGLSAGFSSAAPAALYAPLDPSHDRPTVAGQRANEGSLLHLVRRLIALRRSEPELAGGGPVQVLHDGFPLVYRRGRFTIAVNPRREAASVELASDPGTLVLGEGTRFADTVLTVDGFGYAIYSS